jgi:hypothetical protein
LDKRILIAAAMVLSLFALSCGSSSSNSSTYTYGQHMFTCKTCSNSDIAANCTSSRECNPPCGSCNYATCGNVYPCNGADCTQATASVVGFCGLEGCEDKFPCAKCQSQVVTRCCTTAGCYYTACGLTFNCNGLFCQDADAQATNYCNQ